MLTADWDSPGTVPAQTVKIKFHLHPFTSFNLITVISFKKFPPTSSADITFLFWKPQIHEQIIFK